MMEICENRGYFLLPDYRDSWDARPKNIHFSVPMEWLNEYEEAIFDEDGHLCWWLINIERLFIRAVEDGVVCYEDFGGDY